MHWVKKIRKFITCRRDLSFLYSKLCFVYLAYLPLSSYLLARANTKLFFSQAISIRWSPTPLLYLVLLIDFSSRLYEYTHHTTGGGFFVNFVEPVEAVLSAGIFADCMRDCEDIAASLQFPIILTLSLLLVIVRDMA